MSGIKSTSGSTPPTPVSTGRSSTSANPQVTPVSPTNPTGGQSNPAVPHASSISALTEGAMLAAVVTARASSGDTMLHTEVGNFRMASRSPIPVGSHVVLEVEAMDDLITARVIAINGEKLASPPSVTLLPVVQANAEKPDIYALAAKLAKSDRSENPLQNITAALTPSGRKSMTVAPPNPPAPTPQTASSSAQGTAGPTSQTGSNSLLTASLSAGVDSRAALQSASKMAQAYAHTTNPGPKPSISGQSATQIQTGVAPTTAGSSVQQTGVQTTPNEVIRATIDNPSLSQQFTKSAGLAPLYAGSKISAVVSSAAAPATLPAELTRNIATGTVISLSGSSNKMGGVKTMQVHIQSPELGSMRYVTTNPPAIGSQVSLSVSEKLMAFPIQPFTASSGAFKTPHLPLLSDWENLRIAMNAVAASNPDLANMLIGSRIPSGNANLGASLLFFISALSGGGLVKWFGTDFTQTLDKSGHGDLLRALSDDFSTLSRLNADPGGNDWKALVFPFFAEDKLHQLRMFYRKHSRANGEDADDETRFVVELDLSKSGPVQLDGLLKPKNFDLVLRHQKELPDTLKSTVGNIFRQNMEITGLSGSLTYRNIKPFPFHPLEEWEAHIAHGQNA